MATSKFAIRWSNSILNAPVCKISKPRLVGKNLSKFNKLTSKRFNSTVPPKSPNSKPPPSQYPPGEPKAGNGVPLLLGMLLAAGGAYWGYQKFVTTTTSGPGGLSSKVSKAASILTADNATFDDYQKVYNSIAKRLQEVDDEPDEGSYGPVLVRLAWHASGTWDRHAHDGGSSAGTMRFAKEYSTGANSGLKRAIDWIEPIHTEFPWISYGDLYTLGGVTAIQEMGGPTIKWRAGRVDGTEEKTVADGRLPDAAKGAQHIRDLFVDRMGFTEGETVALIGAHALGRCHRQYSGYDGPWTFSPTYFTNDFFKLLRDEKWHIRKWDGPKQFQDDKTNSLMMLPADYALVQDKEFKKWVDKYADDNDLFFKEFAKSFATLLELGVNFKPQTQYFEFTRLDDQ